MNGKKISIPVLIFQVEILNRFNTSKVKEQLSIHLLVRIHCLIDHLLTLIHIHNQSSYSLAICLISLVKNEFF